MSSSAPNSSVNDIWSSQVPDHSTPTPPRSFGRPGVSSGESGGGWETNERPEERENPPEVNRSPEVLRNPESAETEKPIEASKPVKESQEEVPAPLDVTDTRGKIVDKRTDHEKTHRVDVNRADATTKKADLREQEFIEGVESDRSLI